MQETTGGWHLPGWQGGRQEHVTALEESGQGPRNGSLRWSLQQGKVEKRQWEGGRVPWASDHPPLKVQIEEGEEKMGERVRECKAEGIHLSKSLLFHKTTTMHDYNMLSPALITLHELSPLAFKTTLTAIIFTLWMRPGRH